MSKLCALSLPGESELPTVKVHPTVVFSILNHFSRRSDLGTRVIGTLLGKKNGNEIEITNCFGEPFVEEVDKIEIKTNPEYHKQMYNAHLLINKQEVIVGWYSTTSPNGALITNTSSVINTFYAKQCGDELPIHIVVDSTLAGDSMSVRAFVAKPIELGDATYADMFEETKVEVVMSSAETTALYHMMTNEEGTGMQSWDRAATVSGIPSDRDSVVTSVEQLLGSIDDISAYVDGVLAGTAPAIPSVGVDIAHALASLQTYKQEETAAQLQSKVQDMLMVAYLSTLTKTQLKISEKLHAIV
jgi:translation initiation factor 3 subunit F